MELAREIREQLVRAPTHLDGSGCACITDSAGNIHVPPKLLESIIDAKLGPVREALKLASKALHYELDMLEHDAITTQVDTALATLSEEES